VNIRRGHRPPGKVVSRDTLSFLGGWYMMIYQAQFATHFNLSVFLGGLAISGIPGGFQAFSLWLNARTPPSSPDSPAPASSGPSLG